MQVVSGDTQSLFRKSSGLCVFHYHFLSRKPHAGWAPWASEAEMRPGLLGASWLKEGMGGWSCQGSLAGKKAGTS